MKNTILRYALVLTLISVASGLSLGYFQGLTEDQIAENRRAREAAAVQAVLGTDQFTTREVAGRRLFLTQRPGETTVAFSCSAPGFGGPISVMVGVNLESQTVNSVLVLEHTETPGLGAKISETSFLEQFQQKPLADTFRAKQDVQAITGATISSRAVAECVKAEAVKVVALLEGGGVNE